MGKFDGIIWHGSLYSSRLTGSVCEAAANLHNINHKAITPFYQTVIDLMLAGFCCLFMLGCGSTETVSPEITERAAELSSGSAWQKALDSHANALATTLAAQKLTGEQTLETAQAIMAKLNTLEASLVESKSVRKEDDQQSAPNPPAKANTAPAPIKVATPGDFSRIASDGTRLRWNIEGNWNPTILETSAHLREHGIDTNGMTHQEMADIHAAIHEGKPVATKAKPVQYVSRPTYQSSCPGGVCPTNTRQRKGLFGWRR